MSRMMAEPDDYAIGQYGTPKLSSETRRQLGKALRAHYERTFDTQPIPDQQVDLLLRLRQRERELKRA